MLSIGKVLTCGVVALVASVPSAAQASEGDIGGPRDTYCGDYMEINQPGVTARWRSVCDRFGNLTVTGSATDLSVADDECIKVEVRIAEAEFRSPAMCAERGEVPFTLSGIGSKGTVRVIAFIGKA